MQNEKIKVLLVEDDPNLGNLLKEYLDAKGYSTVLAVNGKLGFAAFSKDKFNICILDVMMPVKDGFTLAKEIRAIDKTIPIVFLTAKSLKEDAIEGFSIGADDYITKPFSMEELLLRLKAILRRTESESTKKTEVSEFQIGNYKFDYKHQLLKINGGQQKLTTKESELLKLLCQNMNEVLDRNFALRLIWNDDNYFNGRSMDVYIAKIRKYLKEDPSVELINVHGKGFKLLIKN
ncbi:MAG: two-component system response regulator [Bacteroidetes bacterium RIFCSPLOWO2_12_FULL_35_15]|nr:MAG: two-component system response regulator [Bacteroidetes bacterium RIFCSPLOWO2_12_FULL_35_15]